MLHNCGFFAFGKAATKWNKQAKWTRISNGNASWIEFISNSSYLEEISSWFSLVQTTFDSYFLFYERTKVLYGFVERIAEASMDMVSTILILIENMKKLIYEKVCKINSYFFANAVSLMRLTVPSIQKFIGVSRRFFFSAGTHTYCIWWRVLKRILYLVCFDTSELVHDTKIRRCLIDSLGRIGLISHIS